MTDTDKVSGREPEYVMVSRRGREKIVEYDKIVALMDDTIREELHADLASCENQEFADAYFERDPEFAEAIISGGW